MQRQHILVYVNHTLRVAASSGIQRVVGKIAAHLPEFAEVSFVTWDYSAGQLRCQPDALSGFCFLRSRITPSTAQR
jgi:hypothetical protein